MSKSEDFIARRIRKQSEKYDFPNDSVQVLDEESKHILVIDSHGIKIDSSGLYIYETRLAFREIKDIAYGEEREQISKKERTKLSIELLDGRKVSLVLPAGNSFYGIFNVLLLAIRLAA
jgi:hypothetical protein